MLFRNVGEAECIGFPGRSARCTLDPSQRFFRANRAFAKIDKLNQGNDGAPRLASIEFPPFHIKDSFDFHTRATNERKHP